jgi:hypothetical protein
MIDWAFGWEPWKRASDSALVFSPRIQALFAGSKCLATPPPGPTDTIIHIESVLNSLLEAQRVEEFHEEGRQA